MSTLIRRALWLVVLAAVAGCGEPGRSAPPPAPSMSAAGPSSPGPSADEGWQVLFDGTPVRGLRGYGLDGFPDDRWVVEGGELRTVPGTGVDLVTDAQFTDVEVEFQWRVAPGGNSGVMYRVAETGDPAWTTGPEYQLLDDAGHPDGRDPATSAAAVYDLIAPDASKRLEPVGSFNTSRIVVSEGRVEHWLNGELVISYGWDDEATRGLIAASKFASSAGFMAQESGHVVFQHHGEEAAFRLIRIRALPAP